METSATIAKIEGVKILSRKDTKIGCGVFFDDLNPQDVTVGNRTVIISGTKVSSHFASGDYRDYIFMERGVVWIGSNVFIGMNVMIAKPLKIGDGAIVGANSVVICDIPENQISGGNPARFIKNRGEG